MLTHERLKELLDYYKITGVFKWKQQRRPQNPVGSVAGWWCKHTNSYRIEIDDKSYLAHRLAWFYVYGIWPTRQIDHRNGNQKDNSFSNLREANNSQNQANMDAKSNNATGFRGVSFRDKKYIVQLYKTINGETTRIWKSFDTFEEAKKFSKETSILLHRDFSFHSRIDGLHG